MKTQTKYYKASSIFIVLFFFLFPLSIISQTFTGNIPIPSTDGGGAMIGDIIKTPNHVFVYSLEKVVAYDINGNFAGEIEFNITEDYGKFNPYYFWDSQYIASTSLMAYNYDKPSDPVLYVISPDLKIYIISLHSNSFLSYTTHTPQPLGVPNLTEFKPLHGNCILKYDSNHDRLYWVIDGQNNLENATGSFHVRQRYLFIFDIDNSNPGQGSSISTFYSDHEYSNTANYENAGILDIEINVATQGNPDFFYLSKINSLELWRIDLNQTPQVEKLHTLKTYEIANYGCEFYKMGLEYIHDPTHNIHKIIAYPYRFPTCQTFDDPDIFVLDGTHGTSITNDDWVRTSSPSKKITDIAYLPHFQHVVLSYAADPENVVPQYNPNEDISIFQVLASPTSTLSLVSSLSSDQSLLLNLHKDFNTPIDIVLVSLTEAILCKEDEISFLSYDAHNGYQSHSKLISENNFFIKGVSFDDGKKFVLNAVTNGIEILDNSSTPETRYENGFQANHICMDNDGDKFYLFNKLNTYTTGCYVYDVSDPQNPSLQNLNTYVGIGDEITAPIGDCIYNPYLDHFLISENGYFDNRAARVLVFNNDPNNSTNDPIELKEENDLSYFAKKMFISPDGKLYVMADMNYDESNHPKVFIYSATDGNYTELGVEEIIDLPLALPYPDIHLDFYQAHFCYNNHNNKVYATINTQPYVMCPYNSVPNSMFGGYSNFQINTGLFIEFDQNEISHLKELNIPGKIICPDNGNLDVPSRYGENMYIIGSNFYEVKPPYFDLTSISSLNKSFNDITYSQLHDMLFALADEPQHATNAITHRIIRVYSIDYGEDEVLNYSQLFEEGGQASCIFNNPYDGKIYVHQKTDEEKFGETPVRLLYFDYDPTIIPPATQNVSPVSLEVNSLYPEIDHNNNGIFAFFLYSITTPTINPYNNTIYIPNGGHSCVSKVSFTPYEPLLLEEGGWTWLSFPRMIRDFNDAVWIPDVLNDNIEPDNYKDDSKLQNLRLGFNVIDESIYSILDGWNSSGLLQNIQSTYGYKLYLEYAPFPDNSILFLEGSLYDHFDPNCNNCTLDLVGADKYWVGYYYPISQNIIDAIPDEMEPSISVIKGQYFTCYGAPQSDGSVQWNCAINKRGTIINYGDMVEIIPVTGMNITNFYWTINNITPNDQERAETVYYDYTETSDYTPIFVELDTTENPLEIGAFVNDSCIGASTVLPEDSVVLVPAYSDSLNGEIYFEQYYGSSKSSSPPITEYYVKNCETKVREKRTIHTQENQHYYIVSFKNKQSNNVQSENNAWITCHPNPVKNIGEILFFKPQDGYAEIKLYSIFGTLQNTIFQGHISAGKHTISFEAVDAQGRYLANGTYILSLKLADCQAQTKIIIIQ